MSATVLSVNPAAKTLGELFTPGGTRVYSCPRAVERTSPSTGVWMKVAARILNMLPKTKSVSRAAASLNRKMENSEMTYDLFRRM